MRLIRLDESMQVVSDESILSAEHLGAASGTWLVESLIKEASLANDTAVTTFIAQPERLMFVWDQTWMAAVTFHVYGKRFQLQYASQSVLELLASDAVPAIEREARRLHCDVMQARLLLDELRGPHLTLPPGYVATNFIVSKAKSSTSGSTEMKETRHADASMTGQEPWLPDALAEARYLTGVSFPSTSARSSLHFADYHREALDTTESIRAGRVVGSYCQSKGSRSLYVRPFVNRPISAPAFIWVDERDRGTGLSGDLLRQGDERAASSCATIQDVISIANPTSLGLFIKEGYRPWAIMINKWLR